MNRDFQASVKTYTATVESHVSVVALDLETADAGATVETSPPDANPDAEGLEIPVAVGANTVTITVTAEDGTSVETYTLTVNRNSLDIRDSLDMGSAPLGSLSVQGVELYPAFDENVLSYTAVVEHATAQVTVAAAGKNTGSTVAVNPVDQDTGAADYQATLLEGRNVIAITVTAMDGMTTREYELTVFRTPAPADTEGFLQVDAGWVSFCGLRVDRTIACSRTGENDEMNYYRPEGVFERVSVNRFEGCTLRADGFQYCRYKHGGVASDSSFSGVFVGSYERTAEYPTSACKFQEDRDLVCSWLRTVIEGPFKAFAPSRSGICAIRSDDKVRCWGLMYRHSGNYHFGTIDTPYPNTEFKYISGGYGQACGIRKRDSAVLCWSWFIDWRTGIPSNWDITALPTPAGEFIAVDTGQSERSCGVKVDGTVDCWSGRGDLVVDRGRSNAPGEDEIGYVSVHMDRALVCGLRNDKQMKCWGGSREFNTHIPNNSPLRDNAQLLGVDLGEIGLSTDFDRETLAYTASVSHEVASVTVKPVLTNSLVFVTMYSNTDGAIDDSGEVALAEGANVINIHVISADRTASNTYTVTVTRGAPSNDPTLASLEIEGLELAPGFAHDVLDYTAEVSHDVTTATVNAEANKSFGAVDFEPPDDDSTTDGYQRALVAGGNLVTITVTAPDGVATRTYTVTVHRPESPRLNSLEVESLGLDPTFAHDVLDYETSASHDTSYVTINAESNLANGALKFDLRDANVDAEDYQRFLTFGDNRVAITVVAADGVAMQTYTVTVNRPRTPRLASLDIEGLELFPSFVEDFLDYTTFVSHDTASVAISAEADRGDSVITHAPPDADDLTQDYQRNLEVGDNTVTVTVTAADGVSAQSYTVTFNRPSPPSTDATLSNLSIVEADLSPSFSSDATTYSATVRSHVSVVNLELLTNDDGATVAVTPADANPAAGGLQFPVEVGTNTVTITVTAEDGSATQTYTLTISRNSLDTESAPLGSLTVDGATLYPAFDENVLAYTAVVGHNTQQVTVAAAGQETGSTVAINPADQDDQATGDQVSLSVGRNVVTITVTAMDTTTREYELTVFRAPDAADTPGFVHVDAGYKNYCGLRMDGTVDCRPYLNLSRFGGIPPGILAGISVFRGTGCALRPDGSQTCWGEYQDRDRTGLKVDGFDLTSEYGHGVCVLKENGNLECQNHGNSSVNEHIVYVAQGPFKAISNHRRGACAIRADDKVRCWGIFLTRPGGKVSTSFKPIAMPGEYRDVEFKFISGGYSSACGIRKDNNLVHCWTWFGGSDHVVGYPGSPMASSTPSAFYGEYSYIDAASPTCGVRLDGTVDCVGNRGAASANAPGEDDIGYLSIAGDGVCGVRRDNSLRCWNRSLSNFPTHHSPWRHNAQLHGIEMDGVSLSPDFQRSIVDYVATVENEVESVAVKPKLTNRFPYVVIYSDTGGAAGDDGVVALAEGANVINVHVISASRTATKTYTVTVTRAAGID